jgi:hypothetical protein
MPEIMMPLKKSGLRLAALLVLQILCVLVSHAQSPGNEKFRAEVLKQESIYRSEGEQVPEGYTVDRSLLNYVDALSAEFDRSLAGLGPGDRWLDIGAGKGQAILDYYAPKYDMSHAEGRERRGTKAQAVAMSIEDRRTADWHLRAASLGANQLQYVFNRRLREYSRQELGRFQIITDVIGGFSYTTDLSRFMENVLSYLELNGRFFTVLQDVHSEAGANQPYYEDSPFLTEIVKSDGAELKVCSWLKSITCVQVSCEFKSGWKPPVEAFSVHKVCNDVNVPALAPVHFEAGTPPERRFQLKN